MNFVLRTAHAEEKKKGGNTNPDVRTIHIYIEIADVPSMWGSLRSPNHISKSVSMAESAAKMSVPEKFHPSKSYVFPVRKFGSKAKGRNINVCARHLGALRAPPRRIKVSVLPTPLSHVPWV